MNFNDFNLNNDLSSKNTFIDLKPQGFFTATSLIYPVHAMASSYENVMYNLYQAIQHYKKNILKKK